MLATRSGRVLTIAALALSLSACGISGARREQLLDWFGDLAARSLFRIVAPAGSGNDQTPPPVATRSAAVRLTIPPAKAPAKPMVCALKIQPSRCRLRVRTVSPGRNAVFRVAFDISPLSPFDVPLRVRCG